MFEVSTDYIYCPSRGSKSNANTYITLDLLPDICIIYSCFTENSKYMIFSSVDTYSNMNKHQLRKAESMDVHVVHQGFQPLDRQFLQRTRCDDSDMNK